MFPLANGDCPAKQAVPVSGTQSQQKPVCFSYMLTAPEGKRENVDAAKTCDYQTIIVTSLVNKKEHTYPVPLKQKTHKIT